MTLFEAMAITITLAEENILEDEHTWGNESLMEYQESQREAVEMVKEYIIKGDIKMEVSL